MSYLISYDLNSPGKNYAQLYAAIQKLGSWWHCLDSTWIVAHPGPSIWLLTDSSKAAMPISLSIRKSPFSLIIAKITPFQSA